jgi:hypothetical protein
MTDAAQIWLGIGIGFTLILVGCAVGAALGYGWGYSEGQQDAPGPASHRKTGPPPPATSQLLAAPVWPDDPPTEVIDRHQDPATGVFPAVPAAEYELLTRQLPAVEDETPSAWTRRQALEMDEFIQSQIVEPSNVTQHLIQSGLR